MQLHIRHETHYVYEDPVSYSIQALKLTPRLEPGQRVVSWRVTSPGERIEQVDPYGNLMHVVTFEQPHREARIVAEGHRGDQRRRRSDAGDVAALATHLSRAHAADPTGRGAARPRRPLPGPTPRVAPVARGSRGQHPARRRVRSRSHRRDPQRIRGPGTRRRRLPGPGSRAGRLLPRGRHSGALRQRLLPLPATAVRSRATPGPTSGSAPTRAGSASTSRMPRRPEAVTAASRSAATTLTPPRFAA